MTQIWRKIRRRRGFKLCASIIPVATFLLLFYKLKDEPKIYAQQPTASPTASLTDKPSSDFVTRQLFTSSQQKSQRHPVYTSPLVNGNHVNPYPFKFVTLPKPCTDEDIVIVVHSAAQVSLYNCIAFNFSFIFYFSPLCLNVLSLISRFTGFVLQTIFDEIANKFKTIDILIT